MNEVSTQSHFRDFQLILGRQLDVSIEVVGEVLWADEFCEVVLL